MFPFLYLVSLPYRSFARRPCLMCLYSGSTTSRNSGLLTNSSASFPNPLLNTAGSLSNSFAGSLNIDCP
jgi:hypothetical protein